MSIKWKSIDTAPKDGTPIWAYLYQMDIKKLKWCEGDDEYEPAWVSFDDPSDDWSPEYWTEYVIPEKLKKESSDLDEELDPACAYTGDTEGCQSCQ